MSCQNGSRLIYEVESLSLSLLYSVVGVLYFIQRWCFNYTDQPNKK